MDKRTADLGTAPIGRLLVRLSIPGVIGMVVMSLYNIIDTLWVSGLENGMEAIAALTVLFPLQMVSGALGMGAGAGVGSLVARRFGERRLEEVNRIAGNAVTLPIVMGVGTATICLAFPESLALLFGGSRELVPLAVIYLTTVAFGFPFLMLTMTLNGLYRGAGNTLMPMCIMGASAAVNATLDPFLIYGWGPFPALGLQGAALATLTAQLVGCLVSMVYLLSRRSGYRIAGRDLRLRLPILRDIAQVGAPAFASACTRSVVGSVFNWVLAGFGPAAVAAQGLSLRVMRLVISLLGPGVYQGLLPIVGFNFGAKDYRRMWRAYRTAATWLSGMGFALSSVMLVFAPQVLAPFARDPELARLAVWALRLKISTIFLVEPQMMAVGTFEGMGMGLRAMVLTLTRNVVLVVPALLVLTHYFGVEGAFAAQPLGDVLSLAVAGTLLWRAYRAYPPSASAPKPLEDAAATAATTE